MNNQNIAAGRAATTPILSNPTQTATPSPYTSAASNPQVEALTHRRYSRRRSRMVDRWLAYADCEGFTCQRGQS
jgi:hypothetical protein